MESEQDFSKSYCEWARRTCEVDGIQRTWYGFSNHVKRVSFGDISIFFCNSWWSIQKYIWIQQIMVVSYLLANIFKIHYKLSIIINVDEQQG